MVKKNYFAVPTNLSRFIGSVGKRRKILDIVRGTRVLWEKVISSIWFVCYNVPNLSIANLSTHPFANDPW